MVIRIRMVSRMVIRMVSRMVILWLYGVLEGPQCLLLKWVVVKYTLTGVQGRKKNFSRSLCKTPLFNDGNGERPCPLR